MQQIEAINQLLKTIELPANVELVKPDGQVVRLTHSDDIEIRLRHRIARKRFWLVRVPWNEELAAFMRVAVTLIRSEASSLSKTPRHMLFASVHGVVNDEYSFVAPWRVETVVDDAVTGRESTAAVLEFGDDREGANALARSLCFWPEVRQGS